MANLNIGPIAQFRDSLARRGVSMLVQWEHHREQSTVIGVAFRGQSASGHHAAILEIWPDGGFTTYLETTGNSIATDVAVISGQG